ncbi:dehydrase and lipid transport-domain-containing protein [Kalaharituber pfeilii]|nr:dehydrase and lipid transport-domain-containing protein [Kalaharituber pfeilii]
MAALRTAALRPTLGLPHISPLRPVLHLGQRTGALPIRTFLPSALPSPFNDPPQRISATRTFPYPYTSLYRLISDISSYSTFLPYCLSSTVISRHPTNQSPVLADLRVGFSLFDETFRSKVTCNPPRSVEADSSGSELFEVLKTRWEIVPLEDEGVRQVPQADGRAKVSLDIEFKFTNPVYAALTKSVVPKVAEAMVDAFEKRAREVIGKER